jgi:hypothetical protein
VCIEEICDKRAARMLVEIWTEFSVGTTPFVFSEFFTLCREQFLGSVGDPEPVKAKVTLEKYQPWHFHEPQTERA